MKQLITKDSYVKEVYYRAMEDLLEKKDFLDITTTEIIERSGLSRATFYKHFHDKYELAAWKFSVLFVHTLTPHEYTSPDVTKESLRKHIQYIYDNRVVFKNLFSYSGQNSFESYYVDFPMQVVQKIAAHSGRTLSRRDLYQIKYHAGAAAIVLKDWILTDTTTSVDEIYDIISGNLNDSLLSLYQINKG